MAERINKQAYLLIGGNIGDRQKYLRDATLMINTVVGEVTRTSSIYETAAWGLEDQSFFLNQVLEVKTSLEPADFLSAILNIEEQMGRRRSIKFGPRTIDIDILFYNQKVVKSEKLTIPHPEIQNRKFALVPMNEIAPGLIHPVMNKTISELLGACTDPLDVNKFS
jgi:2-amino-4-hydroxy-6-hydroxymethyldihydropteridine diphosphokinase